MWYTNRLTILRFDDFKINKGLDYRIKEKVDILQVPLIHNYEKFSERYLHVIISCHLYTLVPLIAIIIKCNITASTRKRVEIYLEVLSRDAAVREWGSWSVTRWAGRRVGVACPRHWLRLRMPEQCFTNNSWNVMPCWFKICLNEGLKGPGMFAFARIFVLFDGNELVLFFLCYSIFYK